MADVTLDLSAALQKHNAHLGTRRRTRADTTDDFLKEAYSINAHISSLHAYLRSIRQSYLSTSLPHRQRLNPGAGGRARHLTDAQRDRIDAEAKTALRELNAGIRQLDDVEQMRRRTRAQVAAARRGRGGFQALGKWAAGGVARQMVRTPEELLEEAVGATLDMHRESVVWYLRRKLEEAAEMQRAMMETRVEREVERSKSMLYKTKGPGGGQFGATAALSPTRTGGFEGAKGAAMDEKSSLEIEQSLSPEQLQLFAQENNEMLKHYEDHLDQVRTAERSMIEISELQTTLAQNLEMQSTRIDQLVDDSSNTELNVVGGNRQLKRAAQRWRPARFVFFVSCGLSAFMIAWDLVI